MSAGISALSRWITLALHVSYISTSSPVGLGLIWIWSLSGINTTLSCPSASAERNTEPVLLQHLSYLTPWLSSEVLQTSTDGASSGTAQVWPRATQPAFLPPLPTSEDTPESEILIWRSSSHLRSKRAVPTHAAVLSAPPAPAPLSPYFWLQFIPS